MWAGVQESLGRGFTLSALLLGMQEQEGPHLLLESLELGRE